MQSLKYIYGKMCEVGKKKLQSIQKDTCEEIKCKYGVHNSQNKILSRQLFS